MKKPREALAKRGCDLSYPRPTILAEPTDIKSGIQEPKRRLRPRVTEVAMKIV